MTTGRRLATTFQSSRLQLPPAIPGLLHWAFHGSQGSVGSSNLVPSGAPIKLWGSNIVMSPAYVTAGAVGAVPTFAPITVTAGAVNPPTVMSGGSNFVFPSRFNYTGGAGSGASSVTMISGGQVTGVTSHVGGSNYSTPVTAGQIRGNVGTIDTGIPRSAVFSTGWTIGMVCRVPPSGGLNTQIFTDNYTFNDAGWPQLLNMNNLANRCSIQMFTSNDCALTLPSAQTLWRFLAVTYSGGPAGVENLFSLSDNLQATPYTAGTGAQSSTEQICFMGGPQTLNCSPGDLAFSMVSAGPLSFAALQPIYASVKGILANRGIACL